MNGLREYNKAKRKMYENTPGGDEWAKMMDMNLKYGHLVWGGSPGQPSGNNDAPVVPVPVVVNPLTEVAARFNEIPANRSAEALRSLFVNTTNFALTGSSNEYLRLHATYHDSRDSIDLSQPFITPAFRTSLTAQRTIRGVFGIFDTNLGIGEPTTNLGMRTSLGHTSHYPNSLISQFLTPSATGRTAIYVTALTDTGQLEFCMIDYTPGTPGNVTFVQQRLIDNRIRFNNWLGFARDQYNYYLYAFPTSETNFNLYYPIWVRLCTVDEFMPTNPDKFQLLNIWEADSYYDGTMYFEGSIQIPK